MHFDWTLCFLKYQNLSPDHLLSSKKTHSTAYRIKYSHISILVTFESLHYPALNQTVTMATTILQKEQARLKAAAQNKPKDKDPHPIKTFQIVNTNYNSHPVDIPDDFLAPLPNPASIKVEKVDFANSDLPQYKRLYAVVLDNVLSQEECDQLIHLAERSAGGHGVKKLVDNGWVPAMVNAGAGKEFFAPEYRNSDRIIWDNTVLVQRIWNRIAQGKGIKEYLSALDGEEYNPVMGARRGERWVVTKQGMNERMRFLKYGAGQFFRSKSLYISSRRNSG